MTAVVVVDDDAVVEVVVGTFPLQKRRGRFASSRRRAIGENCLAPT